ncbi:MAG: hypothetical protein ACOYBY_14235 [Dermatophilaceae bacterium]
MTQRDPNLPAAAANPAAAQSGGKLEQGEQGQLTYALNTRFAPHLQAAAALVRQAERDLADAGEALSRARQAAENEEYQSDRLVFMRASLKEELDALTRKTTPKKVRVGYRYLIDRAVELAEGEVAGYQSDLDEQQRAREQSVDACLEAQRQATERLEGARAMQERVHEAEQAAVRGLAVMVEKLASARDPEPSA